MLMMNNSAYIYKKLNFKTDYLLNLLANNDKGFLLESSLDIYNLGRYSFFGIEPFLTVQYKQGIINLTQGRHKESFKGNIFDYLKSLLDKYKLDINEKKNKFPFLGGAVGFFSYDSGIPDLWFAFFDLVLSIDRCENKILIFSSGFPELNPRLRKIRAEARLKMFLDNLRISALACPGNCNWQARDMRESALKTNIYQLQSNFTKENYIKAVKKSLDYIIKGDIYQINLSQQFHTKTDLTAEQLYANLRRVFPVPFGGILNTGDFSIISGSPERFLKYDGSSIITRPMKGTRPRSKNHILDKKLKQELENSQKDKAELLMIVDLERNDLGRVCDYGTVEVESLRNLEEYSTVFQTTAQIKGKLYPKLDRIDIIKACFPGGSITGCPKIRAMQIINELEPNPRGIYTGALGYFSFHNTMDFNILIRSFFKKNKDVYFGVGGGIVYDSKPELEYQETLVKAEALKRALQLQWK